LAQDSSDNEPSYINASRSTIAIAEKPYSMAEGQVEQARGDAADGSAEWQMEQARKLTTGVEKPSLVPETASCRICFEVGGDLIAPCRCAGTSKWIHRSCLNRWRVSGTNPRSLTHCCECGFQYELELHRICDLRSQQMRHQFTRQLLGHSVLWCVGSQLIIIALGMIIKFIDTDNRLVTFLPFEKIAKVSGFFPTLQHYAFTYYFAGLIVFLLFIGLIVISVSCCSFQPPMEECGACVEGCNLLCVACSPMDICWCNEVPFFGTEMCCQVLFSASAPEALLFVALFLAALVVVIGLLAVLASLVIIIMRVVQRYVRLGSPLSSLDLGHHRVLRIEP